MTARFEAECSPYARKKLAEFDLYPVRCQHAAAVRQFRREDPEHASDKRFDSLEYLAVPFEVAIALWLHRKEKLKRRTIRLLQNNQELRDALMVLVGMDAEAKTCKQLIARASRGELGSGMEP